MTFIDWSDSEGMFALLVEYVTDEKNECRGDTGRQQFLSDLLVDLISLQQQFATISETEAIDELRSIHDSVAQEFKGDPVMPHVKACIEELERVQNNGAA